MPLPIVAADYFDTTHPPWNDGSWAFASKWIGTSAWFPFAGLDGSSAVGIAFGPLDANTSKTISRVFAPSEFPLLAPHTTYVASVEGNETLVQKGAIAWGLDANGFGIGGCFHSGVLPTGIGKTVPPCFTDPNFCGGLITTSICGEPAGECYCWAQGAERGEVYEGGWRTASGFVTTDGAGEIHCILGGSTGASFWQGAIGFDSLVFRGPVPDAPAAGRRFWAQVYG